MFSENPGASNEVAQVGAGALAHLLSVFLKQHVKVQCQAPESRPSTCRGESGLRKDWHFGPSC